MKSIIHLSDTSCNDVTAVRRIETVYSRELVTSCCVTVGLSIIEQN
jgi:hypothetical protein